MSYFDETTIVQCKESFSLSDLPEEKKEKLYDRYGLNKDENHLVCITEDCRLILLENVRLVPELKLDQNFNEDPDGERNVNTFRGVEVIDGPYASMLGSWISELKSQNKYQN